MAKHYCRKSVLLRSNVVAKRPVSHECRRVGGSASHPTVGATTPTVSSGTIRKFYPTTMARFITHHHHWYLTMMIDYLNWDTLTLLLLGCWVYCLMADARSYREINEAHSREQEERKSNGK